MSDCCSDKFQPKKVTELKSCCDTGAQVQSELSTKNLFFSAAKDSRCPVSSGSKDSCCTAAVDLTHQEHNRQVSCCDDGDANGDKKDYLLWG